MLGRCCSCSSAQPALARLLARSQVELLLRAGPSGLCCCCRFACWPMCSAAKKRRPPGAVLAWSVFVDVAAAGTTCCSRQPWLCLPVGMDRDGHPCPSCRWLWSHPRAVGWWLVASQIRQSALSAALPLGHIPEKRNRAPSTLFFLPCKP